MPKTATNYCMSLIKRRYQHLIKELNLVNAEYNYVLEVLKEAHVEFEKYYRQYCADNNVPVDQLNKTHSEKLNKIFPKNQTVDEKGLVKSSEKPKIDKPIDKTLQKMYRKAATQIHPDKFAQNTQEAEDASAKFKDLTSAYNEKNWAEFLKICDEHDIFPSTYKKLVEMMKKEVQEIKKKIEKQKLSFSWRLFECEDSEICKVKLIKSFLKQLFNYEVKEIVLRIGAR